MGEIKEHQWTIANKQFICTKCGYVANDEESKFLSSCYWSNFSADIHISDEIIWKRKESNNQISILPPDVPRLDENGDQKLRLGWVVYEELGYWEDATTVIDLRTDKRYTKLTPHWVIKNGFREDLVEEWHPFCLCYDCAYKLNWDGVSYAVGQPKLSKEHICDCCDKKLIHEPSDQFSWNQAIALGLEKTTYQDILKIKKGMKINETDYSSNN